MASIEWNKLVILIFQAFEICPDNRGVLWWKWFNRKETLKNEIPEEPNTTDPDTIRIVLKLPHGARVERRFLKTQSLKVTCVFKNLVTISDCVFKNLVTISDCVFKNLVTLSDTVT
jgi:hypothetical protein